MVDILATNIPIDPRDLEFIRNMPAPFAVPPRFTPPTHNNPTLSFLCPVCLGRCFLTSPNDKRFKSHLAPTETLRAYCNECEGSGVNKTSIGTTKVVSYLDYSLWLEQPRTDGDGRVMYEK